MNDGVAVRIEYDASVIESLLVSHESCADYDALSCATCAGSAPNQHAFRQTLSQVGCGFMLCPNEALCGRCCHSSSSPPLWQRPQRRQSPQLAFTPPLPASTTCTC